MVDFSRRIRAAAAGNDRDGHFLFFHRISVTLRCLPRHGWTLYAVPVQFVDLASSRKWNSSSSSDSSGDNFQARLHSRAVLLQRKTRDDWWVQRFNLLYYVIYCTTVCRLLTIRTKYRICLSSFVYLFSIHSVLQLRDLAASSKTAKYSKNWVVMHVVF